MLPSILFRSRRSLLLTALALALGLALLLGPALLRAQTVPVKKLTASDAEPDAQFGIGVAISGDTAVVGAPSEDAVGADAGAVYVFRRDQGRADNWGQAAKLTASDAQPGDQFGTGLAVSGDTVVVGARFEDAGGADAGAAYITSIAAAAGGVTDPSSIPQRGIALLLTSVESTPDGLVSVLLDNGCSAQSLAILEGGVWKVYVSGAPDQVNAAFPLTLPGFTPFFVRCA